MPPFFPHLVPTTAIVIVPLPSLCQSMSPKLLPLFFHPPAFANLCPQNCYHYFSTLQPFPIYVPTTAIIIVPLPILYQSMSPKLLTLSSHFPAFASLCLQKCYYYCSILQPFPRYAPTTATIIVQLPSLSHSMSPKLLPLLFHSPAFASLCSHNCYHYSPAYVFYNCYHYCPTPQPSPACVPP